MYCRERVRPWGSRASLIVHLAPAARKNPLLAIFALESEWEALSRPGRSPEIAPQRFTWWADELRHLAAGSPTHPVTRLWAGLDLLETVTPTRLETALEGFFATRAIFNPPGSLGESGLRILGESRGFFLEASLLGSGPEIPGETFTATALADWMATSGLSGAQPDTEALIRRARLALATGAAGLAAVRSAPSALPLRVTFALTRLHLDVADLALQGPATRHRRTRPGIAAKLWTAWKAARD